MTQHVERSASGCAPALPARSVGNSLLQLIDEADFARMAPWIERVPLPVGTVIARAGDPIETVCFPEGGVTGFADVFGDDQRFAVGLVGREGFVGWPLLMGNRRWPHEVVARAEDTTALKVDADRLLSALEASPALRDLLLRFASTFMAQLSRTIASNLLHPVERRTARWILLYHDRVRGDEIALTHEEMGLMLGVRRASITDALHLLEGESAIRGLRGRVLVRDRKLLEALAGETYGHAEAEYERMIGPWPKWGFGHPNIDRQLGRIAGDRAAFDP